MRHCALLCLLITTSLLSALEMGQLAPPLGEATWIKGSAPELGDQWTVVEFWATWCPPCRTSIPHLTRLQHQYSGNITIVGLSDEDEATVRSFVEDQGDQMDYNVAANANDAKAWYMDSVSGIPHAFLVDPKGIVAWHGHPMQMDDILAQAVAGTLDTDILKRIAPLEEALKASFQSNDPHQIKPAAQAIITVDPSHQQAIDVLLKVAEYQQDPAAHRAVLAGLAISRLTASRANTLAWNLITHNDLAFRHLDFAQDLIDHSLSLDPDSSTTTETKARLRYLFGDLEGAITTQRHALTLGADDQMQTTLDYYLLAHALARGETPTPQKSTDDVATQGDPPDLP